MTTVEAADTAYNPDALRPLFAPWAEPDKHRQPNPAGGPALIEPGRRPSKALLVPRLRHEVELWRHNSYPGVSDTTFELLAHWFHTDHDGGFRYHFAQREAIETIIYLYEVMGYRDLSAMYSSLFGDDADAALLKGITPEEDAWARYCAKIATGGGKTKVMSLAIVWSYFHRLFEPDSDLAQHFVVIAPNLIVFERLKDDFAEGRIFHNDPLLPPQWKDEFDLQVILQDEPGGGTSRGALYLTNIHRLYERDRRTRAIREAAPAWAGPDVKRAQALKVGEALRERIAGHPTIMVLNDEAHHLHDPGSAWNEALAALDEQSRARGNAGICAQLDFTATPKHDDGTLFRHIVCDFPLGEAVDAGIVKVPVIGRSDELRPRAGFDNAAQKYEVHLKLGYQQYKYAYEEWQGTHKRILFVMTEDTQAANEIASALDSDAYPLLKGRVVNLHTKLKGRIKKVKRQGREVLEFVEDEKAISDDDLQVIRQISRDLDKEDSPHRCVVSVLMLREGWDVKNVTTILPLRPYKAESNILAEQTLGRGLRRMTPPGDTLERVTVVEHQAFVKLYAQELAEEGVVVGQAALDKPQKQTASIFVDPAKPTAELEIELSRITDAIETMTSVEGLTFEMVRDYFFRAGYSPLPILKPKTGTILFEERALFTDELIATLNIDRGLLRMGYTAVSVFVRELEKACQLQSAHATLAPLVQRFIEEVLFERPVSLFDGSVDHRMSHNDVAEHIRATFAPLIRKLTQRQTTRERTEATTRLSEWKPYQATMTPLKPSVPAVKTLFNLVPCDRDLERNFADYCDNAEDVAAFAKNAGPQKLMIDYIASKGRKALYVPDFFVRDRSGAHYLVELKGQEDAEVPLKARAAVQWCEAASTKKRPWRYVFVPMAVFDADTDFSIAGLARACAPRLKQMLDALRVSQLELPLEATPEAVKEERTDRTLEEAGIAGVPSDIRAFVTQAVNQLAYDRRKNYPQFGGAFQPLLIPLEQLSGELLQKALKPHVPQNLRDHAEYFDPFINESPAVRNLFAKNGRNLQKNVVHGANCNRIGTLLFCLEYPRRWRQRFDGIWRDVRSVFGAPQFVQLYTALDAMNQFRNKHVAHVDEPLTDGELADRVMKQWIAGLIQLHGIARG